MKAIKKYLRCFQMKPNAITQIMDNLLSNSLLHILAICDYADSYLRTERAY